MTRMQDRSLLERNGNMVTQENKNLLSVTEEGSDRFIVPKPSRLAIDSNRIR